MTYFARDIIPLVFTSMGLTRLKFPSQIYFQLEITGKTRFAPLDGVLPCNATIFRSASYFLENCAQLRNRGIVGQARLSSLALVRGKQTSLSHFRFTLRLPFSICAGICALHDTTTNFLVDYKSA